MFEIAINVLAVIGALFIFVCIAAGIAEYWYRKEKK